MKKIYIKSKKAKNEKVIDLLERIIHTREDPCNFGLGYNTYNEKECSTLQCNRGKSRSIEELYRVCLSKFPRLTFSSFAKALVVLAVKHLCTFIYCDQINKWVYRKTSIFSYKHFTINNVYLLGKYRDSFLKLYWKGEGTYSMHDVLKEVRINENTYPNGQKEEPKILE